MNNKSPLILPAISWALGLIFAKFFHINFYLVSIFFIIFSILTLVKFLRSIFIVLMIFTLAILRFQLYKTLPKNHITYLWENNEHISKKITGKIISEPQKSFNGYKFILKLSKIDNLPIKGNIIFYTRQNDLEYGDVINCKATLKPFENPRNPNNFNSKSYYESKSIYAKAYNYSYVKIIDYKPNIFYKQIFIIKNFIKNRINKRFYRYKNFTNAIVIAEKRNLSDWKTNLQLSGLSHLLAVSGLHIAIIALILLTLLKIFVVNRNILYPALIMILILYGFITEWPSSVIRAITMITLFLLAKLFQRKTKPNNILAATLIIATAINPSELFSPGFQMSFLAVLTLFNINFKVRLFNSGRIGKILNSTLTVMLYSFVLNIFLAPVTMYNFNSFNMNGIFANLFGIPMLGIILPLAIITIFLPYPLFIPYQYSYFFIMELFEKLLSFTTKLPFHYDFVKLSDTRFLLLLFCLLSAIFLKKYLKKRILLPLITIITLLAIIIPYKNDNKLKIIAFDLKKDKSYLITTPNNKHILIYNQHSDKNKFRIWKIILNYLKKNGISTLNILISPKLEKNNMNFSQKLKIEKIITACKSHTQDKKITVVNDSLKIYFNEVLLKISRNSFDMPITQINYKNFSAVFTDCNIFKKKKLNLSGYDAIFSDYQNCKTKTDFYGNLSSKIFYINVSNKRYAKIISTKAKTDSDLLLSAIDGALILQTDGYKISYQTQLTEKRKDNIILSNK